jgi:predicted 3-demethylubiquinone-9 3-methyltransferase (glyoxalase superfamily)
MARTKIYPALWYSKDAEAAARLYTSVFPDSRITKVWTLETESPSGPPGSVKIVDFELFGQRFQAMTAGPLDPFNHAVSFVVECDDQKELDRYWNALLKDGGEAEQCGWLRDKFGVAWQIVPAELEAMMSDPDKKKAARVAAEMLKQQKFDVAKLKAAHRGG